MSGHSKWATTKRQKELVDKKRSSVFTKISNAITVAARQGGGDANFNFKLRLELDKAKSANMPKDNIERAIKKGTGELEGVVISEVQYEGFGPGHVAVIVDALTDSKNRTVSNLRHLFSSNGGNLGSTNSVLWMFDKKGVIRVAQEHITPDKDSLELQAIDAGAEDIKEQEEGLVILTDPVNFQKVKEALEKTGVVIDSAEVEYLAKDVVEVTNSATKEQLEKFFEALDDDEDVSNYYTNLK